MTNKINSRRKGASGEREAAKALMDALGINARRGQQFSGSPDSPDVVLDLPLHLEVKRVERLNVQMAMDQATKDAKGIKPPVVMHRRNRTPWLVTVRLVDLLSVAKTLCEARGEEIGGQDEVKYEF